MMTAVSGSAAGRADQVEPTKSSQRIREEMPPMLSSEQVESFEENGFLVIQDVLTPEQLAEARRLVDGLFEKSRSVTESDELFDLDIGHSAERPMIARIKNPGTYAP